MNETIQCLLWAIGIVFCAIGVITVGIGIKHEIDDYIWKHSDHSKDDCFPAASNSSYWSYICTPRGN